MRQRSAVPVAVGQFDAPGVIGQGVEAEQLIDRPAMVQELRGHGSIIAGWGVPGMPGDRYLIIIVAKLGAE
ncbi:hypothetical protein D0T12_01620 [Actinomadura spongiicola]|uniref:Uncharacterized protein n=1 Tax=Actinomadura spongiicola TaxID=2303421 RepID=A0A372GPA2_9ACTN|nr:hypothetical protein D0T12_01620 [Actinomadura spongiicola]